MKASLSKIIEEYKQLSHHSKHDVLELLVKPILVYLDWDVSNSSQVCIYIKHDATKRSKKIADVVVLFPNRLPVLYLDIVTPGKLEEKMSIIEERLNNYCRNNPANFAILTDGNTWRMYYTFGSGAFSSKCFSNIKLMEDSVIEIDQYLKRYLKRSIVINGHAFKNARKDLVSYRIKQYPNGFINNGRDSKIREILRLEDCVSDKEDSIGIVITGDILENQKEYHKIMSKKKRAKSLSCMNITEDNHSRIRISVLGYTKPRRVYVVDSWYNVKNWRQVKQITYIKLFDKIVNNPFIPKSCSISENPSDFSRGMNLNEFYYVEGSLGSDSIFEHCIKAIHFAGYNPKKDFMVEII